MARKKNTQMQWYRMDLHVHTPASKDFQQEDVSFLNVLQHAERRNLNILALTDHNTVRGYRYVVEEVSQLEWLKSSDRIQPDEERRLGEYRRLFEKMLILPGFEFTATFGFHILGIFPPAADVRGLEHLLLDLNVPSAVLDQGDTNVGSSADVLTAYAAIREAGGLAIAAHANSSHGVAMRGMSFGGQTRIAYTQDFNLHALEVTDLDRKGKQSTARFFDGSKPEYPRRMRCIQGSDSHRLDRDPRNPKNLGLGERITEVLLPELSYEALYEVFSGTDFARTRPFRGGADAPFDHVLAARQQGPSIVQTFHEGMEQKGGKLYDVIADVCAFANGNGGTLYIGVSEEPKAKPKGVSNINPSIEQLKTELARRITPPIEADIDILQTEGVSVIRVQVPAGVEPPYAIDDNKIYVRGESETDLAVRDEIVQLVLRRGAYVAEPASSAPSDDHSDSPNTSAIQKTGAPRTGVEIVGTEKRDNTFYHYLRDLRNGNIVRNVTRSSARKLWHYAISQAENHPVDAAKLAWQGDLAVVHTSSKGDGRRYDLAQKIEGQVHIYYGVTEDGLQDEDHHVWRDLLGLVDEES